MLATMATTNVTRTPIIVRTNRSRPRSSVPKMCPALGVGARRILSKFAVRYSFGLIQGPIIASTAIAQRMPPLTMTVLLVRMRAQVLATALIDGESSGLSHRRAGRR